MKKNIKQALTKPWLEFADNWKKMTSPGRPSKNEMKIYKGFLNSVFKKNNPKILILGSTPEIRDMLAESKKVEVTLVDINHKMTLAMTNLMNHKTVNENWIKADWLNAPLAENYFDAVIGDFVISNVLPKNQQSFLKNISKWLKQCGLFITRCEGYPKDYKPISIEYLVEWHLKKHLNLETYNCFCESGIFYTAKPNSQKDDIVKIDVKEFWKNVDKIYEKTKNSKIKKLINESKKIYPLNKIWFAPTQQRILKLFSNFFTINDKKFDYKLNMICPENYLIYKLVKK